MVWGAGLAALLLSEGINQKERYGIKQCIPIHTTDEDANGFWPARLIGITRNINRISIDFLDLGDFAKNGLNE